MTTIMPPSELLRRAVSYISDIRRETPHIPLATLVDDAAMRFNLSPVDSDALLRLLTSGEPLSTEQSTK